MTQQLTTFRTAGPGDVPTAAHTLALAFRSYPWTRWTVPEENHAERIEQIQRLYLGHAVRHGLVVVDDTIDAVAAALPPDAPDPADDMINQIIDLHGEHAARLGQVALPSPAAGAWSLATLGVAPDAQGAGLGGALLAFVLAELDAKHSAPVHLETSAESNLRFYRRHGFATTATTLLPDGGPTVWSMSRPATG